MSHTDMSHSQSHRLSHSSRTYQKVDDHGRGEGVVSVTADVAGRVGSDPLDGGDVLGGKASRRVASSGTVAAAAAALPLVLLAGALVGAWTNVHGHVQGDLCAGLSYVGQDHIGKRHGAIPGRATDVTRLGSQHSTGAQTQDEEGHDCS